MGTVQMAGLGAKKRGKRRENWVFGEFICCLFFFVDLEGFVGPGMWLLETIIVVFFWGVSRARRCIIRVRVKDGGGEAKVSSGRLG